MVFLLASAILIGASVRSNASRSDSEFSSCRPAMPRDKLHTRDADKFVRFLDTNILLYSISTDTRSVVTGAKPPRNATPPIDLIDRTDNAVSVRCCRSSMCRRRARNGKTLCPTTSPSALRTVGCGFLCRLLCEVRKRRARTSRRLSGLSILEGTLAVVAAAREDRLPNSSCLISTQRFRRCDLRDTRLSAIA